MTMPKGKVFKWIKIILTTQTRRTGATNVQIKLLENETQQLVVKRKDCHNSSEHLILANILDYF